jgi:diguanylate cyclase (GGDEF)-like protein
VKSDVHSVGERPIAWWRRQSRAYTDALLVFLLAIPVFLVLLKIDAFDLLYQWSRRYEDLELDEWVLLALCIGVAAVAYSVRRVSELRRETEHRQRAELEASRLARHDALTGLPNRRRFLEEFDAYKGRISENDSCALFVVDLDRFKPINDLYGHRLGDEVLRVIARRLGEIVAGRGIVARLGGDEFGILLISAKGDELPVRIARQIVYEIPKPIKLAALEFVVGVSVGIGVYEPNVQDQSELSLREGSDFEVLLRQADMAMYRAKTEGRDSTYHFFDKDMDERLQQRVQLEREIKGAISRGEIIPYYQPLVELSTQRTIGFEVLARWLHPSRGILAPSVFIPIAEDTGAIGELTYALLSKAAKEAASWPPQFFLSLNLSPRLLADPSLAARIIAILTDSGLAPQRLEIELTETAIVQRLQEAKATLQSLRNLGMRIALDDFGTGYAGLYHLRELHLDTIKIDRSFVGHMLDKPEEEKIVQAMVSLGRSLGLRTTAEGIETEAELQRLMLLGCETGQGYLFGRPEPAADTGR